jgi:hypothetical protein
VAAQAGVPGLPELPGGSIKGVVMRRNTWFLLAALLVPLAPLPGETVAPFVAPSARFSGMGGIHTAVGDDFYSLFTNPASFVDIKDQFSVAELTLSLYGPVFEILDLAASGGDDISGLVENNRLAFGVDIEGPLSAGWVGRGLGFGIFSHLNAAASVSGSSLRPLMGGDILILAGYSFRAIHRGKHTLDLGFMGKGFFRETLDLESSIFAIDTMFGNPKSFKTALGMGFDLGIKYSFNRTFSASLVAFDAFSPALVSIYDSYGDFQNKNPRESGIYGSVNPRLALGFAYRISSPFLDRYVSDFMIMADYRDFVDLFHSLIPRNFILNMSFGLELRVLEKLSLRLGIADALPSAGFGIDFGFMKFDFAMYGREMGLDPGVQPVYAIDLSFLFRY